VSAVRWASSKVRLMVTASSTSFLSAWPAPAATSGLGGDLLQPHDGRTGTCLHRRCLVLGGLDRPGELGEVRLHLVGS